MSAADFHPRARGFTRRQLIRSLAGGVGAAALAPSLLDLLCRHAQAHALGGALPKTPKRLILLWLEGGPSQIDTFDPKPGAATQGPFGVVPTDVAGWSFGEHLPRLAQRAGKLGVIRSVTSKEGSHARARLLLHTGYIPNPSVPYPTFGSVVANELGDGDHDLPSFVQVSGPPGSPGYLGVAHAPFLVLNPNAPVANLAAPAGVDAPRFDRREALRDLLDARYAAAGAADVVGANRTQHLRSRRLMESPLRAAFELTREKEAVREAYGRSTFGQGVLLARRLVEQGVQAVEVHFDGWDTHIDNFAKTKGLCEQLDPALSALLDDLDERGLLADTLVVAMGEFGRTPTINVHAGRDHWPGNYCALLAGGGAKGGVAVGTTDERGEKIVDRPVTVPDLFATFAHLLGIDGAKKYHATPRRPTTVVDPEGEVVSEIVAP
jgi:uncharacterized protein (DUF1501 family)